MIYVGSARYDENGRTSGGKAGDSTGKEVATQGYYSHRQGWLCFRCEDKAKADKIAYAMKAACDNNNIGYDQNERDTLYNAAKPVGFDTAKVAQKCETDCSALVRVCLCYAGFEAPNFNTESEPSVLKKLGFKEVSFTKATGAGLKNGDILVTPKKGHTVIVVSGGMSATVSATSNNQGGKIMIELNELKKGSRSAEVRNMQRLLTGRGYSLGKYGTDGDFGALTDAAVRAFQKNNGLAVDGIVGKNTWNKLLKG